MRVSTIVLAALLFITAGAGAQANGVAGDWNLSINTPGGVREAALSLKVDGDTLTGTIGGPQGEVPLKGTTKDNAFTFSLEIQTPNGTFSISVNGEVSGDEMKGTLDFGQGTGDFTGKRKAN